MELVTNAVGFGLGDSATADSDQVSAHVAVARSRNSTCEPQEEVKCARFASTYDRSNAQLQDMHWEPSFKQFDAFAECFLHSLFVVAIDGQPECSTTQGHFQFVRLSSSTALKDVPGFCLHLICDCHDSNHKVGTVPRFFLC